MTNVSKAQLKVELLDVGHGDALLLHWIPEQGDPSTILVDGEDVSGAPSDDAASCRVYLGSDLRGVPPLATIVQALKSRTIPATQTGSRSMMARMRSLASAMRVVVTGWVSR